MIKSRYQVFVLAVVSALLGVGVATASVEATAVAYGGASAKVAVVADSPQIVRHSGSDPDVPRGVFCPNGVICA